MHDVDHRGVSNARLGEEQPALAQKYRSKSIAEQNSIDKAWMVLMRDEYKDLRRCIYTNDDELERFRQIIVNNILATDIFDKELGQLRKERWNAAFSEERTEESPMLSANRKATIVIEHIIQASEVAHCMQHWYVYRTWNERLFHEMYLAFRHGRAPKHPKEGWYKGELWFFDNYIIPLAKKLESCGVFGVSSDECLNYATANRVEWEAKGEAIVAELTEIFLDVNENDEVQSLFSVTMMRTAQSSPLRLDHNGLGCTYRHCQYT